MSISGQKHHRYELVPGWLKLPHSVQPGNTHGVAVDAASRVYIFNVSAHAMVIVDDNGQFISSWNHGFEEGAHGLTYSREREGEFLYLCDCAKAIVCKTTLAGEIVWRLDGPPGPLASVYGEKKNYKPTNLAIAPNGDVFVADGYGKSFVHHFDQSASYIGSFGGNIGGAPGQLHGPHGIICDTRGDTPVLLIADRDNRRIQSFSLDYQPLGVFGADYLRYPCHFHIQNGDMVIPDLYGRVTIVDQDNRVITHLGDNPGIETREGYPNFPIETWQSDKFISPHSACWDHSGNLLVVEWIRRGRVTKLRRLPA